MVLILDWVEPFLLTVKQLLRTLVTFGGMAIGVQLWNLLQHFNLEYTKFKLLVKNGVVMEMHLPDGLLMVKDLQEMLISIY